MAKGKYQEWLEPDGLLRIEGWARDGLVLAQIAHNLGCTLSTLCVWKDKYPQISEALKRGKEVVDREVENALLKRALGYNYDEVTAERVSVVGDNGERTHELLETKRVTKMVIPDVTAQIIWLKNRKPDQWRDKPVEGGAQTEESDNLYQAIKAAVKREV